MVAIIFFCHHSGHYWGHWSQFSKCSVTCGDGVQVRHRMCTLSPDEGPKACSGDDHSVKHCNWGPCPQGKAFRMLDPITGPIPWLASLRSIAQSNLIDEVKLLKIYYSMKWPQVMDIKLACTGWGSNSLLSFR